MLVPIMLLATLIADPALPAGYPLSCVRVNRRNTAQPLDMSDACQALRDKIEDHTNDEIEDHGARPF